MPKSNTELLTELLEEVEKMFVNDYESDHADDGFLFPTLYLERRVHNQALSEVSTLIKKRLGEL